MDYQRVYDEFIADRRTKEPSLLVFTTHHVTPRAHGGDDRAENLIRLTDSDHLFAHILLAKIHRGAMSIAAVMMLNFHRYRGRRSRLKYQLFRDDHRKIAADNARGNKYSVGRVWTPEQRESLRVALLGNKNGEGVSPSQETRDLIADGLRRAHRENPKTMGPETRERMAAAQRARRDREKAGRVPVKKLTREEAQRARRDREKDDAEAVAHLAAAVSASWTPERRAAHSARTAEMNRKRGKKKERTPTHLP